MEQIGPHAFYQCYNLHTVNLSTSPAQIMIGGSAFQHCEALETLVIPSDYDMTWNHDATIFYDTDSLTCYYGPDEFMLPCSQCTDEHNETRPICEETVESSVSTSSYSSTFLSPSLIFTLLSNTGTSTSTSTLIIVFLCLSGFVSIGAVYMWYHANYSQGRVHPKQSKSEPPRLKGRHEVQLDKNQCKKALSEHNLVWDSEMESLFEIISDAGYVTEARLYVVQAL